MASADTEGVPVGAGTMAAGVLLQSIDWAATALGPISGWSPTLRTMVGLLLSNRLPLSLCWGPELVHLYNDAYRPLLGDRHPQAMAQPAKDCFRETWDTVGPMIESPFHGGPPTASDDLCLLLRRDEILEERHFELSFRPVADACAGGIGGVLGTHAETTERVYAARQQRTLREIAVRATDAETAELACTGAATGLAENAWDVPFALLYLLDETGQTARLAASVGFGSASSAAAPAVLQRHDGDAATAWPFAAISSGDTRVIQGIDAHFGALPSGRWSAAPHTAVTLALEAPGQRQPYGIFIGGVSPHRPLDARYREFFELAAAQIATAIGMARAREAEQRRARALASIEVAKTELFRQLSPAPSAPLGVLDDAPRGPRHPHAAAVHPFEADVRILVADASADARELIARALGERWGVTAVSDGDAALKVAREWQPELVLTDVLLPGLSGFGLLRELRKDARTRACSIIMLSARSGPAQLDALEAGANDYLIKPFSARELIARVSAQVQLARLRKVAEAERAHLFGFLMQLPVAIAACEGPNHTVTLKNPLADTLTRGRLELGDTLSDVGPEYSLGPLIEALDRVYASGEPEVWREQTLSIECDHGGCEEREYDVALQPLRDAHGAVTGIVAAAYEVHAPLSTRRKHARRRELAAIVARERSEELDVGYPLQAQTGGSAPPASDRVPPSVPLATSQVEPPVRRPSSGFFSSGVLDAPLLAPIARASTVLPADHRERPPAPRRVLVVDDDHEAASLLEETLIDLGFSVAVAHDGPSALQVARSFGPDTALVDVGLPGMDGLEVARRLRGAEAGPGALRLIAVTGYGRESDRLRSKQAGFDLHLVKPVALDALCAAVADMGERRFATGVDESAPAVNDHGR